MAGAAAALPAGHPPRRYRSAPSRRARPPGRLSWQRPALTPLPTPSVLGRFGDFGDVCLGREKAAGKALPWLPRGGGGGGRAVAAGPYGTQRAPRGAGSECAFPPAARAGAAGCRRRCLLSLSLRPSRRRRHEGRAGLPAAEPELGAGAGRRLAPPGGALQQEVSWGRGGAGWGGGAPLW